MGNKGTLGSKRANKRLFRKKQNNYKAPIITFAVLAILAPLIYSLSSKGTTPREVSKSPALAKEIIKANPQTITAKTTVDTTSKTTLASTQQAETAAAPEEPTSTPSGILSKGAVDHTECKELGYCLHKLKEANKDLADDDSFVTFKVAPGNIITDIEVLKERVVNPVDEGRFEEALDILDTYVDQKHRGINALRRSLKLRILARDKIAALRAPLKPLGNKTKIRVVDHMAIAAEEKKRKPFLRDLQLHNDIVNLSKETMIVWNERKEAVSYSRLIRACRDKKSRSFPQKAQKAKDYLEKNKGIYSLVEHKRQKVNIRRADSLVAQVYYGTSSTDEYGYKDSRRNIGYIVSMDLKPLPTVSGGGGGC